MYEAKQFLYVCDNGHVVPSSDLRISRDCKFWSCYQASGYYLYAKGHYCSENDDCYCILRPINDSEYAALLLGGPEAVITLSKGAQDA